ncbi:MAG: DUF2577 domain-containing protein [Candidatus Faecalibacterium intestinavium]|uniref:DUF2577 domain-containing protein n=1 Tax=Candidatus Faecalibacterium intestinavium TaxID=2838580 RepID=A0A9E2NSB5_9FIRM|nr:DUF2577 domain-containing protein [Candidatus Faecalibacterium intestinavium]
MNDVVELIKRAALEAVEASKPVHLLYGEVISASPLKIQVDQKSIYTEKMLILTRAVTDFEMDVSLSCETRPVTHGHPVVDTFTGGGIAQEVEHKHRVQGVKKLLVHNSLVAGDKVLLARVQQGKKFVVLDRISPHPALKGEWL